MIFIDEKKEVLFLSTNVNITFILHIISQNVLQRMINSKSNNNFGNINNIS